MEPKIFVMHKNIGKYIFPLLTLKVPIIGRLAGWEIGFLSFMPETVNTTIIIDLGQ